MASVDVLNDSGSSAGSIDLDDAMFGVEPNVSVMHQVVVAQLAAHRKGTASTKTRAEVRGGGRKPWRQKGTGNARQGSIRAPHWRGAVSYTHLDVYKRQAGGCAVDCGCLEQGGHG